MKLPQIQLPIPRRGTRGFTLIESISVLAILAILASAVTLNMVERMKLASRQVETTSMESMAEALRSYIIRTKRIPAESEWPAAIAQELGISVSRVQKTRMGNLRTFMADPTLSVGAPTNTAFSLPYVQGMLGTVTPANPRLLVVSSVDKPLPSIGTTTAAFTNVWSTREDAVPSTWTSWRSTAEDLRIQRIDLRGIFKRVVFNNLDPEHDAYYAIPDAPLTSTAAVDTDGKTEGGSVLATFVGGFFSPACTRPPRVCRTRYTPPSCNHNPPPTTTPPTNTTTTTTSTNPPPSSTTTTNTTSTSTTTNPPASSLTSTVPTASSGFIRLAPGQSFEAWFIETTPISLLLVDGSVQAREFVRDDVSYIFEDQRWNRYLTYGPRPLIQGFGELAEEFRLCATPPGTKFGATPQAVIEEMFTYLYSYGNWATGEAPDTLPFDTGGSSTVQQVPAYQALLDSQARMARISGNLLH